MIDDVVIDPDDVGIRTLLHNAIDRFTCGVRDGFLFSEQMLWRGRFEIHLTVTAGKPNDAAARAETAFWMAVDDLCEGRLAIGAASGRGHGRIRGIRR